MTPSDSDAVDTGEFVDEIAALMVDRDRFQIRGGEVWIDSDGFRGTTIHFTWPKEPDESDAVA